MNSAKFLIAYNRTAIKEGIYSNDPNDAGGETVSGISRVYHPNASIWITVDNAKRYPNFPKNLQTNQTLQAQIKDFYEKVFFGVLRLEEVNNQDIINELFDTAVNMSTLRAAKFLQTALTVSNDRGRYFPDLVVDGIIGPATIAALNKHPRSDTVLKLLNVQQGTHYINECLKNPSQEMYLNGWFTRVFETPMH